MSLHFYMKYLPEALFKNTGWVWQGSAESPQNLGVPRYLLSKDQSQGLSLKLWGLRRGEGLCVKAETKALPNSFHFCASQREGMEGSWLVSFGASRWKSVDLWLLIPALGLTHAGHYSQGLQESYI